MSYTIEIKDHTLEYLDETHTYLVDGIIVPSITQLLTMKFGTGYERVPKEVLNEAARKGTEMHESIERLCKGEKIPATKEIQNFKFLKKMYKFKVIDNEVPIILFDGETPIAAGRLDMVIEIDGKLGLADLKRTANLDKNRLAYQLNLYRIGFQQSYGKTVEFLRGIHLREDTRKFVPVPINEYLMEEIKCLIQ